MRVNIYAEEMTQRIQIIEKEVDGNKFTALRFYLELPATSGFDPDGNPINVQGPFIHRIGDDDSSAVTFWGKGDLRKVLQRAIEELDKHHASKRPNLGPAFYND